MAVLRCIASGVVAATLGLLPAADALAAAGLALHVTHVVALDQVEPTVQALWDAVGRPGADPWLGQGAATSAVHPGAVRRTAFIPIWRRPWMTINADTYGATARTLRQFVKAYHDLVASISDIVLPNPDVKR